MLTVNKTVLQNFIESDLFSGGIVLLLYANYCRMKLGLLCHIEGVVDFDHIAWERST